MMWVKLPREHVLIMDRTAIEKLTAVSK